ncbi:MAG: M24 family metallopeptidase [Actinomycetota bacterium]
MDSIYSLRVEKLRQKFPDNKLDCLLALKDKNIYYLSGFYGKDSGSILLVCGQNIYLIVSFIYFEQAKKSAGRDIEIIQFKNNKQEKLKQVLASLKSKRIGIEESNVTLKAFGEMKEIARENKKKLISAGDIIEGLRLIKDQIEINNIKRACGIADKAFKQVLGIKKEKLFGLTEAELGFELERLMAVEGASGRSFDIIVANNASSSLPHYVPGRQKIRPGILLADFGCMYNNYCSDITRTFFIDNKKDRKIREIYDIVLQAQQLAIENCREGITCKELDKIAREYIEKKGYGENFGHGLGHGVGLEVHEGPTINSRSGVELKENMVVTIEPGIYIEGIGGVRIEDMAVVKKGGCEILYTADKSCIDITE